jgi:dCTP deaminase
MLSDLDILDLLTAEGKGRLIITPLLSPRQIQSASIDLRLGFHFKVVRNSGVAALDPLRSRERLILQTAKYTHDVKLRAGEAFYIHPRDFALGTTLEYVRMPVNIAASLEGRSSFGRLGVTIHSTAGFIDPGFSGRITYEIQNEGTQPIALYPGMRVAQLCFYKLSTEAVDPYDSKYKQQLTTTSSRWYDDPELDYFRRKWPPE